MKYGKKVRVLLHDGKSFEGFLIPSPDRDAIMLKLDNGYNIGFVSEQVKDIIELEEEIKVAEFPTVELYGDSQEKRRISIVVTGGTIMSRVDYRTGGVHMFLKPEELLYQVPELQNIAVIKSISNPFSVASEDITPSEWKIIAKEVEKELNSGADGVIIPHGTDTMHYTSSMLSFMLRNLAKPVALTGAQRSSDRPSSDAFINMIAAAIYATSDFGEVSIVMHASTEDTFCYAHRGTRVRKLHTERRDAFKSVNDSPLAKIYPDGRVEIINESFVKRDDSKEVVADTNIEEKVAMIYVYPGSSSEIIDFYVDKGYEGVVLMGTGFGHVPTETLDPSKSWIKSIQRAVESNVKVVMTSQTIFGRTNPYVYSNGRRLRDLGVIYVEDMLPEVAYTKLMWVLGHTKDYREVKKLMRTPLSNEIKDRSLKNEFFEE